MPAACSAASLSRPVARAAVVKVVMAERASLGSDSGAACAQALSALTSCT